MAQYRQATGRGHDAIHVRELGLQRAGDREIVDRALADLRILLTFDLDFGEILALGDLTGPSTVAFSWQTSAPTL